MPRLRLPRLTIDLPAAAAASGGIAIGMTAVVGIRVAAMATAGAPIAVAIAALIIAGVAIIAGLAVRRYFTDLDTIVVGSAAAASAAALLFAFRPVDLAGPAGVEPLLSAWLMTMTVIGGPALAAALGVAALILPRERAVRSEIVLTAIAVGALMAGLIGERLVDLDRLRLMATIAAIAPAILFLRDPKLLRTGIAERRSPTVELQLTEMLLAALPAGLVLSISVHLVTTTMVLPLIAVFPPVVALAALRVALRAPASQRVLVLLPAGAAAITLPLPAAMAWPLGPELLLLGGGLAIIVADAVGRLYTLPVPATGRGLRLLAGVFVGLALTPLLTVAVGERLIVGLLLIGYIAARLRVPGLPEPQESGAVSGIVRRTLPFVALSSLALMGTGAILAAVPTLTRYWILTISAVAAARSSRLMVVATALPILVATAITPAPTVELRGLTGAAGAYGDRLNPISWVTNGPALVGVQRHSTPRDSAGAYARTAPIGQVVAILDGRPTSSQAIVAIGIAGGDAASYAKDGRSIRFLEPLPELAALIEAGRVSSYLADVPGERPVVTVGQPRAQVRAIADDSVDLLIIDARFGWAISPTLLTVEAMNEWARVLRPDGIVAIHLSARGVDVEGPTAAAAATLGLTAAVRVHVPAATEDGTATPSTWMAISATPATLAPLLAGPTPFRPAAATQPWYDRQIDAFGVVRLLP